MSVLLVFLTLEAALVIDLVEHQKDFPKIQECADGDSDRLVSAQLRWQFHPRYGWTGVPESSAVIRQTVIEDRDRYSHDGDGWRDSFDSGDRNAIVLGDSFTYGILADDNTTYEQRLDRWTPDVAFHNFALGGYATANQYQIYEDVAEDMEHDLVVVGYATNDAHANTGGGDPLMPQFELEDGELVLSQEPNYTAFREQAARDGGDSGRFGGPAVETVQALVRENTETYGFLAPRLEDALVAIGVLSPSRRPAPPSGESFDRQLAVTEALLDGIAERAANRDATVLLVYVPTAGQVDQDRPLPYRAENRSAFYRRQRQVLEQVADNNSNVYTLDLRPSLRQTDRSGTEIYGTYDQHLNEAGYNATAAIIYRKLHDLGELERPLSTVNRGVQEASACAG